MKIHCRSSTTIFNDQYVETFVGKTAYSAADTLIGEDSGYHYILYPDVVQNQTEIRTCQGTVGCLSDDNLIILRGLETVTVDPFFLLEQCQHRSGVADFKLSRLFNIQVGNYRIIHNHSVAA